jgi:hypothetical protein
MKLNNQVMNRKTSKKLPFERKNSQGKFNSIKYKLKKTHKFKPKPKHKSQQQDAIIQNNPNINDNMEGGFISSIINWFKDSDKRKMLKKIVRIFKKIITAIKLLKTPHEKFITYNKKLKYNVENHTTDVNMLMYRYQELIIYDKREFYYKALKSKEGNKGDETDYLDSQIKVDAVEILKINNSMKNHEKKKEARDPEIKKIRDSTNRDKLKLESKEFKKIEAALAAYAESGKELEEIKIQLKNYSFEVGVKSKEKQDKEVKRERLKAESFYRFFRNFKVDEKKVIEAYDIYSSVVENIRDIDVSVANYNSLDKQYINQKTQYEKIKKPLEEVFGNIMPKVIDNPVRLGSVIKEYDTIILEYQRLGPVIQNTLIPKIKANKDTLMIANQIVNVIQEEIKLLLDYLFTLNPLGSELGKRMELIISNNAFILSFLHTIMEGSQSLKSFLDRGSISGGAKYITQHGGADIDDADFNGNLALHKALFIHPNTVNVAAPSKFTSDLQLENASITAILDLVKFLVPEDDEVQKYTSLTIEADKITFVGNANFEIELKKAFKITTTDTETTYLLYSIASGNSEVYCVSFENSDDDKMESYNFKNYGKNMKDTFEAMLDTITEINIVTDLPNRKIYYSFDQSVSKLKFLLYDTDLDPCITEIMKNENTDSFHIFLTKKTDGYLYILQYTTIDVDPKSDTTINIKQYFSIDEITITMIRLFIKLQELIYFNLPKKYNFIFNDSKLKDTPNSIIIENNNMVKFYLDEKKRKKLIVSDISNQNSNIKYLKIDGNNVVFKAPINLLNYAHKITIMNEGDTFDNDDEDDEDDDEFYIYNTIEEKNGNLKLEPIDIPGAPAATEIVLEVNKLYYYLKNERYKHCFLYLGKKDGKYSVCEIGKLNTGINKGASLREFTRDDVNKFINNEDLTDIKEGDNTMYENSYGLFLINNNIYIYYKEDTDNNVFRLIENNSCFKLDEDHYKIISRDDNLFFYHYQLKLNKPPPLITLNNIIKKSDDFLTYTEVSTNYASKYLTKIQPIDCSQKYTILLLEDGLYFTASGNSKYFKIATNTEFDVTINNGTTPVKVKYKLNNIDIDKKTVELLELGKTESIIIYQEQLELVDGIAGGAKENPPNLLSLSEKLSDDKISALIDGDDALKKLVSNFEGIIGSIKSSGNPEYVGVIIFKPEIDFATSSSAGSTDPATPVTIDSTFLQGLDTRKWDGLPADIQTRIKNDISLFKELPKDVQKHIIGQINSVQAFNNLSRELRDLIGMSPFLFGALPTDVQNQLRAQHGPAFGTVLHSGVSGTQGLYAPGSLNPGSFGMLPSSAQSLKPGKASSELLDLMLANKESFEKIFKAIEDAFNKIKDQDGLFRELNKKFMEMANIQGMIKNMAPDIKFPKGEKVSLFYTKDKESNKINIGESPLEKLAKTGPYSNMVKAMEIQISDFMPELMSLYADEAKRNPGKAMISEFANMSTLLSPETKDSFSTKHNLGVAGVPSVGFGIGSGNTIGQITGIAGFPKLIGTNYPQTDQRAQRAMQELAPELTRAHQLNEYSEFARVMSTLAGSDVKRDVKLMTSISLSTLGLEWIKDEREGLKWLAGTKDGNKTYTYILAELRNYQGNAVNVYIRDIEKLYDEFVTKKTEETTKQAVFTAIGNRDLALQAGQTKL